MATKALTAAEKKWLKDVQDVLSSCPTARLAAYANGDMSLGIFDQHALAEWQSRNESPGSSDGLYEQLEKSGARLGRISIDLKITPA